MRNSLRTIRSPFSVNYEVTPVCNLRCQFCFAGSECKLKHPQIGTVIKIIDELARAEVFEIRLFGGEFFSYPQWRTVVRYAQEKEMFLTFVSNGNFLDVSAVTYLTKHGVRGGAISIHGPEKVHDKITGVSGSYQKAISGLRTCLESGMSITVLTTITQENKERIPELISSLEKEGLICPSLSYAVSRLCPFGRGKDDWEKEKIHLVDYLKLFPILEQIRKSKGIEASFGDAFPYCLVAPEFHHLIQGCWQGTGFGHISHTGEVRGCSIAKGSYGNLLDKPLEKIWQGKALRKFRNLQWLPSTCQNCKNFCGGGCSASRLVDSMYAPDEFLEG